MFYQETIAAIATSSKNGSISILRISGEEACRTVSRIFYNGKGERIDLCSCETHTIHYGFIKNRQNELLDEVLVLLMRAPRSYTAEDVVEIHCHGGFLIAQTILEELVREGARIAEPGEFTKRAFLNGRLDLSQAEAVMDVIQAESRLALKNSLTQLRGDVREKINTLREMILEDTAFLEAALDDPEHIPLNDFPETMREHTRILRREVEHLLENSRNGRRIKEGIRTAIVGKPNVGKSSFLNCILRENRAIVTDIPGTTRDTLEEEMLIGSTLLHMIDTAGLRNTGDAIEKIGMDKTREAIRGADLILCILDTSMPLTQEDRDVLGEIEGLPVIFVLNKSDLDPAWGERELMDTLLSGAQFEEREILSFSARTGAGLPELEACIKSLMFRDKVSFNDDIYITNARQKQALADAAESLRQLEQSIEEGVPEDLYSIDLYNAYESLGKIVGETVEDDIIDKIFRDFCMGK